MFNRKILFLFTISVVFLASFQTILAQQYDDSATDINGTFSETPRRVTNNRNTGNNNLRGRFVPVYSRINNPNYRNFNEAMRRERRLEIIATNLNKVLRLPTNITITARDCGQPNAFYDPRNKTITMCYEFMDLFYNVFTKAGYNQNQARSMMYGATVFFAYHELGHALIDVYDLPAVGREEDAVDQLSLMILMEDITEEGTLAAIAGITVFNKLASNETPGKNTYAGEHSLSSVRFYNLACWMYGRDPNRFSNFVTRNILPRKRAVRCRSEYSKLSRAWIRLLRPYLKTDLSNLDKSKV